MNKIKNIFATLLLLIIGGITAIAQNFPVQANLSITPPYSVYLQDYISPGVDRMAMNVLLTDLTVADLQVKLKVTIEGQGVKLTTRQSWFPEPIILSGGVPERYVGFDLADYFNPNNLDFAGITRQEFSRTGALPEGVYRFCIEVQEYNRNATISNAACVTAWVVLNDPPLINFPANNVKMLATYPQNVLFQWTPRHTGSPNSAFSTEYEFKLVEIWPEGRNPNDAILSSNTIYETTTQSTTLVYGIAEPALEPGRSYAFRVQAKSIVGIDELDLFRNDGYSETRMFIFGDECKPPVGFDGETLTTKRIKASWDAAFNHTEFNLRYREKNDDEADWFEETTFLKDQSITALKPDTDYEFQVMANCGTLISEYTELISRKTAEDRDIEFACGVPPGTFELGNTERLPELWKGEYIYANDFDIKVDSIAGGNGTFTGTGLAEMPFLSLIKVRVKFTDITVNTDYRMIAGQVATIYNPNSNMMVDLDEDDTLDEGDGSDEGDNSTDSTSLPIDITYDGDIDSVYVDDNGDIIVKDSDGNTDTLDGDDTNGDGDTVIEDENGDTWTVGSDGTVTPGNGGGAGGSSSGSGDGSSGSDSTLFVIAFEKSPNQKHGFDKKEHDALINEYEVTQINKDSYLIPWKSVASGSSDYVDVFNTFAENEAFPDTVQFRTETQALTTQSSQDQNKKQLTILGTTHQNVDEVTAYVPTKDAEGKDTEQIVGKLNVISYDRLYENLYVVPVNYDASAPGLEGDINKIYAQAGAELDVHMDAKFIEDSGLAEGLDEGESGNTASFTKNQRAFNRAFKRDRDIDKDGYYVFLVKGSSSRKGRMPFKRQFGYIFVDELAGTPLATAIAHEVAHGAFRLRHTFSTSRFIANKGTTLNLMDYSDGTNLRKYQWDNIHDPEAMISWFQQDQESALEDDGLFESNEIFQLTIQNKSIGKDQFKTNYKLSNWEEYADIEEKDKSKYQILLFIERDSKIVYSHSTDLLNTGVINWHGLVNASSEQLLSNNQEEFKLNIGIIEKQSENETFEDWNVSYGSRPQTTVIGAEQKPFTFVDLHQNIAFTIDKAWEDWNEVDAEVQTISSYEEYAAVEDAFKNENNGIGEIFAEVDNPLQFLYDNSIETTFLGTKVRVHWKFAEKLQSVESRIQAISIKDGRYVQGDIGGIGVRPQYGGSTVNVSNHSYGVVVDIKPNYNHFISSGQRELLYFIEHVTGLNLFDRQVRNITTVTQASSKFTEYTSGLSFDELITVYQRVDNYVNSAEETYKIKTLNADNPFIDFNKIKGDVEIGIIELTSINNFYSKLLLLDALLNSTTATVDMAFVIFNDQSRIELKTFSQALSTLKTNLSSIENNLDDIAITSLFSKLANLTAPSTTSLIQEYSGFRNYIGQEFVSSTEKNQFTIYATLIKTQAYGKPFIKHVFTNGFCELPLELIEAFENEEDMQWGGIWGSNSNVDYMHFEIRKQHIAKYLSQKKTP